VKGPVALIGVAEKGYVSLRLSAQGAGGHSSMPPPRTAVGVVAQAVTRLEQSPFPARMDHAGRFFAYVGPKMPMDRRLIFANLWLFEPLVFRILSGTPSMNATIRTTTAPTMFHGGVKDNVLPIEAEAVVNFRILPGDTPESVKTRVEAVVDDPEVTVAYMDGFRDPPSPVSDVTSASFALVRDAIRQATQDPELVVAPYLTVGATDSRYFQPIADNTFRYLHNRLGPKDLARLHGTDERIAVANYLELVRFYYLLIRNAS
jgi:carboxypeptidase PM20D1